MHDIEGRRPLKVRQVKVSGAIATFLSKKNITPNQISVASVIFALAAACCLWKVSPENQVSNIVFYILAALFIQCRLLCNLFDGMVAIEGGKSTASGELYNDIPDRIADPVILIAAGSISQIDWAMDVAWLAALLAVGTAYIRTLGKSIGAPADFRGPMAKQHRMAIITLACLLSTVEMYFWSTGTVLLGVLVLICIGCLITMFYRVSNSYQFLEREGK